MPDQSDRPCRRCNKKLLFVRQEDNEAILPLDSVAPVYLVYLTGDGERRAVNLRQILKESGGELLVRYTKDSAPQPLNAIGAYVTHFATCPQAAAFSKGRQQQPGR